MVLHRSLNSEKLGLTLCYGSLEDEVTDIFISEVNILSSFIKTMVQTLADVSLFNTKNTTSQLMDFYLHKTLVIKKTFYQYNTGIRAFVFLEWKLFD